MIILKNCFFFLTKIYYLGHFISPGSLELDPQATDAIWKLKDPTNDTEVHYFLVLCNFFWRFVPKVSIISTPINLKLRKGLCKKFDRIIEEKKNAISKSKELLVKRPYFRYQDRPGI